MSEGASIPLQHIKSIITPLDFSIREAGGSIKWYKSNNILVIWQKMVNDEFLCHKFSCR